MTDERPTPSSSGTNSSTPNASPNNNTNDNTTSTTDVAIDRNTSSSVLIELQIKSLEQRTHSVTLPRNSSVLQLKNEIQATLDVDSGRQRLIFQGKVLKDDKNLMDYANLDNGKVIHLVIRPLDAPQNPLNDEPRPTTRRTFGNRGRPFPSIASRLPMMEGYTFITLDAHIGDDGDNNSLLSTIMNGLTGANPFNGTFSTQNERSIGTPTNPSTTNESTIEQQQQQQQQSTITSNLFPGFLTRSPFELRRSLENTNNTNNTNTSTSSNTTNTTSNNRNTNSSNNDNSNTVNNDASNSTRTSIRLPLPSSVEMRLSRSVAYIRNVSNILEAPADQQMSQIPYTSASSPEFIQEIRSTLRGNGNSQSYQVGMVMNELSDLMERGTPWLRETARNLQNEGIQTSEENVQLFRRVIRAARVIQGMSLINHFMGSVLTSVDMDGQRGNGQETIRTSIFDPPISGDLWHPSGNEESQQSSSTVNDQSSTSASASGTTTQVQPTSTATVTASSSNTITPTTESNEESTSTMEIDNNRNKRKRDEDTEEETISNKQLSEGKFKNKTD